MKRYCLLKQMVRLVPTEFTGLMNGDFFYGKNVIFFMSAKAR
jgi:hypothetical protein